ncbi:hypothetical protein STEG23_002049 [Scotinomys teguina]
MNSCYQLRKGKAIAKSHQAGPSFIAKPINPQNATGTVNEMKLWKVIVSYCVIKGDDDDDDDDDDNDDDEDISCASWVQDTMLSIL